MGPSSTKSDVGQGICRHMSVLVRGKQKGDVILMFLSYLILSLLFAQALDALLLPEQMISKRLFIKVKCYKPMKKKAGVCLAK